ncbi:substrate-binding domain-containing protein [Aurantimonas sp. VKM B-3413]|uniref:substrate-binding domain-containing protein n=1 Tax=Aurantimonas sp. VKM B-3413 TaxID=2779401 RepID=UPI001E509DDF|nr:substrate-binding domain-containing protein [Aurantimonas sp. VKM B-3413]MCB8837148.1 substrate-binding domain-containing protein [Aurantimonas sp. VKM B-3413]
MLRPNKTIACLVLLLSAAGFSAPAAAAPAGTAPAGEDTLRVCADPNNLPFSNRKGEGFENKLADLVAKALGKTVSYTWWAQRRGFIRNTLTAGRCDVVMGVPTLDMLGLTRSYYGSTYVIVSRKSEGLDFSSIQSPQLKSLTIGVHLIGDDGANTPPVEVLGREGIVDNVVGYMIYGDYSQSSPPERILDDVANGRLDVAIVWGPLAGYYAKHSEVPLTVTPVTGTEAFMPLVFQYRIGMGVRKGDEALRLKLNDVIARHQDEIDALLDSYGVPRV